MRRGDREGATGRGVGDREGDDGEGGNGVGEMERGATRRGRWGGEMGRGDGDGGNGKEEMRRGKRTGKLAKGRGRTRGKRRGDFTDGYEMLGWTYGMSVWNKVTELFDFVYPCNAGYPS